MNKRLFNLKFVLHQIYDILYVKLKISNIKA